MRNYLILDKFLDKIKNDIGFTLVNSVHDIPAARAVKKLANYIKINNCKNKVLDIGCGEGRDLEEFNKYGIQAIGISLSESDINACVEKGLDIYRMDQNFMYFDDSFGAFFASHILEHSPMPYFTLHEYNRILDLNGVGYIEVPSPKPWSIDNQNHYSIFPKEMWEILIKKSGFEIMEFERIQIWFKDIEEEFWGFYVKKIKEL